jgi:isopenicillin-N epimerase
MGIADAPPAGHAARPFAIIAMSPFRHHWPLAPDLVFLNHGSYGATPTAMLEFQQSLQRQMEASPVRFMERYLRAEVEPPRQALARFLNTSAANLVPVANATTAVNAVARSWPLRPGDEILTTNLDYNACRNALAHAAAAAGATLVVAQVPFPLESPDQITAAVFAAVTDRTRFAMIDHVTSGSAMVLPVEEIVAGLEGQGTPVLVDGAHAPGMLPLDLTALRPSWYCGNLHKWPCAPKGCAFLWAREDRQEMLQPAVISHGNNTRREGFTRFQDRFDWCGTHDPTPWLCLPAALDHLAGMVPGGWPEIRQRNHAMTLAARKKLCHRLGVAAPCPEEILGSMATVPMPPRLRERLVNGGLAREQLRLHDEFQIEVPCMMIGEEPYFRVSAHLHNHPEEYSYLADCLERL